jgi:cytochrome c oxidase subunit 2
MPPGDMASAAKDQQFDINVMSVMAAPVVLFVLIYGVYAVVVWRHREGDDEDGPPIHGNTRVAVTWIALSSAIVLGLFVFGTVELIAPAGSGAGEGNTPIWKPSGGAPLQVQVIAQQWRFTYRYPQFGGFDANPDTNNVAYTKTLQTGNIVVRCAELCGLWHGAMFDYGKVVSKATFQAWAASTRAALASVTKLLPAYALTYDPTVVPTLIKAYTSGGLFGAGGAYYGSQYGKDQP